MEQLVELSAYIYIEIERKKKKEKREKNGFDLGSPGSYYGLNYLTKSTELSPILNQFYFNILETNYLLCLTLN